MRAMSENNRSITMPAATFFALTDIVAGTYPHDYIICTNGNSHETWIEVIPATAEIGRKSFGRKFKEKDSLYNCLNFLSHVKVLGWYAEGIEEKVQHVPDMDAIKDHYSPSFKRVEDIPSKEDIIE